MLTATYTCINISALYEACVSSKTIIFELRMKKFTSNNASASITIREMPVRGPDSSVEEMDWHKHEPSACTPRGQAGG